MTNVEPGMFGEGPPEIAEGDTSIVQRNDLQAVGEEGDGGEAG